MDLESFWGTNLVFDVLAEQVMRYYKEAASKELREKYFNKDTSDTKESELIYINDMKDNFIAVIDLNNIIELESVALDKLKLGTKLTINHNSFVEEDDTLLNWLYQLTEFKNNFTILQSYLRNYCNEIFNLYLKLSNDPTEQKTITSEIDISDLNEGYLAFINYFNFNSKMICRDKNNVYKDTTGELKKINDKYKDSDSILNNFMTTLKLSDFKLSNEYTF